MPRPSITRRQAAVAVPSSNALTNFTRIAKSQAYTVVSAKTSHVESTAARSPRKRKADSLDQDSANRLTRRTVSFPPSSEDEAIQQRAVSKRPRRAEPPKPDPSAAATGATEAAGIAPPSDTAQAFTKGKRVAKAGSSTGKLTRQNSQATIVARSVQRVKATQTRLDAIYNKKAHPAAARTEEKLLFGDFSELVALNTAFLKTIIMYIAHNGCSSPINIDRIAPDISRTWGRRQVSMKHIQRCIAIQSHKQAPQDPRLIVTHYGLGRFCVEVVPGPDGGARIDQERMCRQFEDNLQALCAEQCMNQMTDVHIPLASMTLSDLPQAPIQDMGDGLKANPLFTKGQAALNDLRTGIAAKRQGHQQKQTFDKTPLLNADGTKMGLLDRIRHKQLAKANEPLPPSGPELQRRAALNRVADVAATISMLSLSNPMASPRQAFTMMAIADKLKDSLRVPLSNEEAMTCVRLIATEIAPDWLRIVFIGGRENVVIQRHGQPIDRIIHERVQRLLAA
ncbi:hypothetical protein E4U58_004076 [Claviceps cyperi]|nr:hypothetical protein E4U58_004076 [Claviceps cyperi]